MASSLLYEHGQSAHLDCQATSRSSLRMACVTLSAVSRMARLLSCAAYCDWILVISAAVVTRPIRPIFSSFRFRLLYLKGCHNKPKVTKPCPRFFTGRLQTRSSPHWKQSRSLASPPHVLFRFCWALGVPASELLARVEREHSGRGRKPRVN
jgi:hypothetical protein